MAQASTPGPHVFTPPTQAGECQHLIFQIRHKAVDRLAWRPSTVMNILIDAHMLGEQEGGNETYIAGLLQGLEAAALPDGIQVTALSPSPGSLPLKPGTRIRSKALARGRNFYRVFVQIPSVCRHLRADVIHMTYNASPFLPCPLVLSVHDVIFRRYPEYFSPRVRLLLSTLLPLSMRRAAVVLTLSEASKKEIIHYYPFVRDKISVIPIAPGPVAHVEPDATSVDPYCRDGDFILAVGTVQPRKNLARLIEAYVALRQRGATTARLIIVGRLDWRSSEIQRLATLNPYREDIVLTGYLGDAALAALYRRCAVFVYPSLYEGFGLPVVEGMACGAPVITSNLSSLPEVAGEAALLVDPYAIDQISAAMEGVLNHPELRADLRARGLRQAARFSWETTARRTFEAYEWAVHARPE